MMIGRFIVHEDDFWSIYDLDMDFELLDYSYITSEDVLVTGLSDCFEDEEETHLITVERKSMEIAYVDVMYVELNDFLEDEEDFRRDDKDEPTED